MTPPSQRPPSPAGGGRRCRFLPEPTPRKYGKLRRRAENPVTKAFGTKRATSSMDCAPASRSRRSERELMLLESSSACCSPHFSAVTITLAGALVGSWSTGRDAGLAAGFCVAGVAVSGACSCANTARTRDGNVMRWRCTGRGLGSEDLAVQPTQTQRRGQPHPHIGVPALSQFSRPKLRRPGGAWCVSLSE